MYWLIPVGIIAGVTWIMSTEDEVKSKTYSLLEKNFRKLKKKLEEENKTKILIIGQPGAGKSSLLKYITNNKCIPKPIIGQKTDATHWHDKLQSDFFHRYSESVYVDSPGYDTKNHPLHSYLDYFPFSSFQKVIFVLHGKIHDSDKKILMEIKSKVKLKSIIIVHSFSEKSSVVIRKEIKDDVAKVFNINIPLVFFSSKIKEGINEVQSFINNKDTIV
jgi:GTPase Era involved in 16S rRNA processing